MQIATIACHTIPHEAQRYDTVGDWRCLGRGKLSILCSDLGDWRMNAAIMVHEMVEGLLCTNAGLEEDRVTRFDTLYEERRKIVNVQPDIQNPHASDELLREFQCDCEPTLDSEPGEDVHAPYLKQHAVADVVERLLIHAFGLSWTAYANAIENLDNAANTPR